MRKRTKPPKADCIAHSQGTVWLFRPLTKAAQDFIAGCVQTESWQWFGNALCVEWRCAGPLPEGMAGAGLKVERQ